MKKKVGVLLMIMAGGFVLFVVVTFGSIYSGVVAVCGEAKKDFGGECRGALEKLIDSDKYSAREKNKAVWGLGQLANRQSLGFLEGKRDDGQINSYELNKAIKWCKEGNWTSWMYKSL